MPASRVHVMLSSRNRDSVQSKQGAVTLESLRRELKAEIEEAIFVGSNLVDVWINEEAGAEDGTADTWNKCLSEVDEADVVIVLYNGDAGWSTSADGIGICHAEFLRALSQAPARLRVIAIDPIADPKRALATIQSSNSKNKAFARDLDRAAIWRVTVRDAESLRREVRKAVGKSVIELAKTGSREARRGRFDIGAPLDWSRFTYKERRDALVQTVNEYLTKSRGTKPVGPGHQMRLGSASIFVRVSGVPAGMGTPEAREMVGRPYLDDHEVVGGKTGQAVGPLHIIACHKTCSESHAISFMGHPDQYLVEAPFGIFAADRRTFVQAAFITQCRDSSSTKFGCQRLFDWFEQSGEIESVLRRATSRARVLQVIAAEIRNSA